MRQFKELFNLYKSFGIFKSCWIVLRVLILPFRKLDKIIPSQGKIVDIGCGNGGFSNYLSITSPDRSILGIDLSKPKINYARETQKNRRNVNFQCGNILSSNLFRADCFLLIDVLHHLNFMEQEEVLKKLVEKLRNRSLLVIKEVDKANFLPFLFGHFFEKILYPKLPIYARTKDEWTRLFNSLNLSFQTQSGTSYFPDSTLIFICKKNGKGNQ